MTTHALLRTAIERAGMTRSFRPSGAAAGLVYPHGWFTRHLRVRTKAASSPLRLAASDLGVARVELTLTIAGSDGDAALPVYEQVDFLWAAGYSCHFSRVPDSTALQLKAHVFIAPAPGDPEFLDDIPTVADADALAAWVRTSVAACQHVLAACARAR